MRKTCYDCVRKHLAQALVISHELPWYAGDEQDDHFWVMIGHLAEAGDQSQRDNQFLADQIRDQRLILMKEGPDSVRKLDIARLIRLASESAEEAVKPPVVTDPPGIMILPLSV